MMRTLEENSEKVGGEILRMLRKLGENSEKTEKVGGKFREC